MPKHVSHSLMNPKKTIGSDSPESLTMPHNPLHRLPPRLPLHPPLNLPQVHLLQNLKKTELYLPLLVPPLAPPRPHHQSLDLILDQLLTRRVPIQETTPVLALALAPVQNPTNLALLPKETRAIKFTEDSQPQINLHQRTV